MSLRQFISARYLLRSLKLVDSAIDTVTDSVTDGWKEVASIFGWHENLFFNPLHKKLRKPVTAILIGAGHRGTIYADYAIKNPDELTIVAIAETNHLRNSRLSRQHKIKQHNSFHTWEDVFKREKFADAIIIATPDKLHTAPCLKALEMGYDILLEKPIAPTEAECRKIYEKAKETGRIVGVCHVLRYTPYFRELKEIIDLVTSKETIEELELEKSGVRLRIKRASLHAPSLSVMHSQASSAAVALPPPEVPTEAIKETQEELYFIKSPIVGTFYKSPSPTSEAFVSVGDFVEKGSVVCIVEAMKLMNEIESDVAGEIITILVENGQPVEYGERLFAIRPR